MSVPRSVSRAIPRPPLAVQKVADNRLESLMTVAPFARRQLNAHYNWLEGLVAEAAWGIVAQFPCVLAAYSQDSFTYSAKGTDPLQLKSPTQKSWKSC